LAEIREDHHLLDMSFDEGLFFLQLWDVLYQREPFFERNLVVKHDALVRVEAFKNFCEVCDVAGLASSSSSLLYFCWDPVTNLLKPVVTDVDQKVGLALSDHLVEELFLCELEFVQILTRGR
jgi:hypothetical protein